MIRQGQQHVEQACGADHAQVTTGRELAILKQPFHTHGGTGRKREGLDQRPIATSEQPVELVLVHAYD